jgi:hypothetical protein
LARDRLQHVTGPGDFREIKFRFDLVAIATGPCRLFCAGGRLLAQNMLPHSFRFIHFD